MKVLKPGNIIEHEWVGECHFCMAIIAAPGRELREAGMMQGLGEPGLLWVDCPECYSRKSVCMATTDSGAGEALLEKVKAWKKHEQPEEPRKPNATYARFQ